MKLNFSYKAIKVIKTNDKTKAEVIKNVKEKKPIYLPTFMLTMLYPIGIDNILNPINITILDTKK